MLPNLFCRYHAPLPFNKDEIFRVARCVLFSSLGRGSSFLCGLPPLEAWNGRGALSKEKTENYDPPEVLSDAESEGNALEAG